MRGRGRGRGRMRACEGESECEGEGIGEGVLYILIWRGARASARWRGRRRGSVHGRGALQARDELRASTQRNCMQARSARERRGGGMPSAREGKQADANDRRASGSSIETRKPATRRTFSETSKQRGHVHALLIFLLSRRVHEDCQSTPLSISGGKYQLRQKSRADERVLVFVPARGRPIGLKRMKTVQRASRTPHGLTHEMLSCQHQRETG